MSNARYCAAFRSRTELTGLFTSVIWRLELQLKSLIICRVAQLRFFFQYTLKPVYDFRHDPTDVEE